ncbi:recombination-associated protein RdgC [Thiocapsa imhoffii]|uniref:Recombination-associated protein RdgC n=1 Tax=Thiocapsa imhoffii TaxID=382777 RepID=A0A9X0WJ09_9GAMM|nr:recombination-associated protein RdgC [Thiocapsa imhoffii]MBK1645448.1 recombination-associated protein RdgC [Thiocapsa imhoffii]
MFKNVRFYRLGSPFGLAADELETALTAARFRPCGPIETATIGWSPPLGDSSTALVHAVSGCFLMCARKQERLLPAAAITEALEERVADLENAEARDVGRAERRRLREQVMSEMLPRAFTRSRRTLLYVDTQAGWLVVDAASDRQAEDVISLLRETIETLPARPPAPRREPPRVLTAWLLNGDAPPDVVIGDACELRDANDTASLIRCRGQDLASDEILAHLRAGKQVLKLAVNWDDRLDFVLAEDLSLKRLRITDALLADLDDGDLEPAARLDAELAILALQLRELIARLDALFGLVADGEVAATAADAKTPAPAPAPQDLEATPQAPRAGGETPPWED